MGVSELNAPVEPPTPIVEPETPIIVPELPSSKFQDNNGGAPKLERSFEPAQDDTGFLSPSRLTPQLKLPPGQPHVSESPASRRLPESNYFEPNRSNPVPSTDGQNISVLERDRKRIKATLISSRKIQSDEPRVIYEAKPVPFGAITDGQDNEIEIPMSQQHTVADQPQANIVLQARPDPTRQDNNVFGSDLEPAPQHLSVADANTVDHDGLPDGSSNHFEQLPPMDAQRNVPFGLPISQESRFEEPPLDDLAPNFRSLPAMSQHDDKFTSTSYQTPTRDEMKGRKASDFVEVQNSGGPATPDNLKAIQQRVDSVFRIVPESVAPPVRQVQILRLRAATPLDHTAKIPPIVSINVDELIIVRGGIHPDIKSPLENADSPYSTVPSRPIFDEKRLECSIRGLTTRPDSESTTKPDTIER